MTYHNYSGINVVSSNDDVGDDAKDADEEAGEGGASAEIWCMSARAAVLPGGDTLLALTPVSTLNAAANVMEALLDSLSELPSESEEPLPTSSELAATPAPVVPL